MAGKIHTDSEALYAIRGAITKFAGSMQEAQNEFMQCFEQMNYQIDDSINRLRVATDDLFEEKRSAEREIEECVTQKNDAERKRDQNREGSTDSFVCRNDSCGVRMMLKIPGDTTICRTCGGTMHRVYTGGEFNRYNVEAYQLEQKIKQLQEKVQIIEEQIKKNDNQIESVSNEFAHLRSHQETIIGLLTFTGDGDPETATSFISNALERLDDYQSISFGIDGASAQGEDQKKNINNSKESDSDRSPVESADIQEIMAKETLSSADRAKIRDAIMNGEMGEYEIRTIGSRVRERYNRFLVERREEFDYLQSKKRELAIRFNNSTTDEERKQIASETMALKEREVQYREKYGSTKVIKSVLESYRDIGPSEGDKGQSYDHGFFNSSQDVIDAINSIRDYLPTEWVEKSNEIPIITKHVNRGYFNMKDGIPTIALSTAGSGMQRCAFHEMGHFFEQLYPEIRKLEYQFYNRRTAGEDLKWLGIGYSRSEVTRFDNFVDPYMGKDYGNSETSGYEIFSMGMESIFANSYDLSSDPEYVDLMLGILATV